ncbi:hypothetical protein D9M69_693860 [compost metagenome]
MPARVSVALPLAPAEIVAPPPRSTVSVPLATLNWVVARLPSTSTTLMPVIGRAVSSSTPWAPGTVLTGASLTGVTVIEMLPASVRPPGSATT